MGMADTLRNALNAHKPHGGVGFAGVRPAGKAPGHPMDRMLARGSLSDEEYLALCRFRAEYEAAAVRGYGSTANWDNLDLYAVEDDGQSGRMRASKQPKTPRSDPARVVDTLGQINAVFVAVGPLGFEFLRAVAVLGLPLVAVAGLLSIHRDIAAFRFREAVETLADHYGDAA